MHQVTLVTKLPKVCLGLSQHAGYGRLNSALECTHKETNLPLNCEGQESKLESFWMWILLFILL